MQASVKQLVETDINRLRPWVAIAVVIGALLLQAYLPQFLSYANLIDLPLLVTVYLALLRRSPIGGLSIGVAVGLAQDSLSLGPIGLYGILKTIVGYICSSLTLVIAVESLVTRVVLVWAFYLMHQGLFWVMQRVLLVYAVEFAWQRTLLLAFINAAVALVLFRFLDRFRETI